MQMDKNLTNFYNLLEEQTVSAAVASELALSKPKKF